MTARARLDLPAEVVEIATTLEAAGHETWCVGGALRDAHFGTVPDDVDLATSATPDQVQSLFRHTVPVGIKFGTVGVLDRHRRLHEVTTFRHDVQTDGRHAVVAYGASLEDDLARRDFTINAMAYHPLRGEWRDPFGGAADLERRVIRAVGNPADRFREDYLRILRAIRFAARLDFSIDPATWSAAMAEAGGLDRLSAERVRDEWFRSLETAQSLERMIRLWHDVGAARQWMAGLVTHSPFPPGPIEPRDPVALTAALVADPVGTLGRLKASGAEIERVGRIVAGPRIPESGDERVVRRWLAAVGPAADDLILLDRWRTGRPGWVTPIVSVIRSRRDPLTRSDLAVSGADLIAAGIGPGPHLGRVLAELLDAVLDDPGSNRREVLLARARRVP